MPPRKKKFNKSFCRWLKNNDYSFKLENWCKHCKTLKKRFTNPKDIPKYKGKTRKVAVPAIFKKNRIQNKTSIDDLFEKYQHLTSGKKQGFGGINRKSPRIVPKPSGTFMKPGARDYTPLPNWGGFSASPWNNRAGNAIPCQQSADWLYTDRSSPQFPLPRKRSPKSPKFGNQMIKSNTNAFYNHRGKSGFKYRPKSIYMPGGSVPTRSYTPYTGAHIGGRLPQPYGPIDNASMKGYPNGYALPNGRLTTKRPSRRRSNKFGMTSFECTNDMGFSLFEQAETSDFTDLTRYTLEQLQCLLHQINCQMEHYTAIDCEERLNTLAKYGILVTKAIKRLQRRSNKFGWPFSKPKKKDSIQTDYGNLIYDDVYDTKGKSLYTSLFINRSKKLDKINLGQLRILLKYIEEEINNTYLYSKKPADIRQADRTILERNLKKIYNCEDLQENLYLLEIEKQKGDEEEDDDSRNSRDSRDDSTASHHRWSDSTASSFGYYEPLDFGPFMNQGYAFGADAKRYNFGEIAANRSNFGYYEPLDYGPFMNQGYSKFGRYFGTENDRAQFRPHAIRSWKPNYNSYANKDLYLKSWNPYQNNTMRSSRQQKVARGARDVSKAWAMNGSRFGSPNLYQMEGPNNASYRPPFHMYTEGQIGGNTVNYLTKRNYLPPCYNPKVQRLKVAANNNPTGYLANKNVTPVSGLRGNRRNHRSRFGMKPWTESSKKIPPWVARGSTAQRPYTTQLFSSNDAASSGYTRVGQPLSLYAYQNNPNVGSYNYPEFSGPRNIYGGFGRSRKQRKTRTKKNSQSKVQAGDTLVVKNGKIKVVKKKRK